MLELVQLDTTSAILLAGICFIAGAIRGFAGFGLSAFAMACAVSILSPLALVPMLWWLEMSASLFLMKGGWADADRKMAVALTLPAAIGLPLGLALTMFMHVETSRLVALLILLVLAASQLARVRLAFLETRSGLYCSGFASGIVTGLCGAGAMVLALVMLARQAPARTMRGSLNIYLLSIGVFGLLTHLLMGTMDQTATWRGMLFALPSLLGVFAGKQFFTPRYEPYYKPVCLTLLIALALAGILRLVLQG